MLSTTFHTGAGYWNPLVWLGVFLLLLVLAYLFWFRGESGYRREGEQTKPFLSGNRAPARGEMHLRASHLYWGFTEAIRGYYERVVPAHTGVLNDYLLWFLGVMSFILVIMVVIR
ncbi:MAG: hydrogenase [Methanomicrobiales archaeon]|nr:hydrogenase [Methanomicrobiales archaeon]